MIEAFSLAGRVALVTGSTAGIGRAVAGVLAQAGATVAVNGRDIGQVARVVAEIPRALPAPFDVTDYDAARLRMDEIAAAAGGIDILVLCAAMRDRRSYADITPADYRRLLETNTVSYLELSRAATERMRRPAHGRLIFITSTGAKRPFRGDPVYASSKAAVESLVRSLACELGPGGTTVNGIAPGFTATEHNAAWVEDEAFSALVAAKVPPGRWARPEEIGYAAAFLASDAASYVNGHILTVDGGMSVIL